MRMRLRAPDEPEAESSYDDAAALPDVSHNLPPLDVGSPEYIEERLENLKRRPNWGEFLDQYVQEHPDSDSESESGDAADGSVVDTPGFVCSTFWSLLVVAFAPLLVICTPCLRHKRFWPLGCRSLKELFACAVINVASLAFGLVLLYWTICRELPDIFNVDNTLVKLNVQMDEVHRAAGVCHATLMQWERTVAQELCMPVGIDAVLLLLNMWLLLHCHSRWARYLMVLMAVMFVMDTPTKLYDATFPAPEIYKVDPTFALVDEELLVALDGKNLKPGGSVAWVAYWGCATTSDVDSCEKQFVSTFEAGIVPVTFKSLDHFIPCYRDPPNPLKAQEYQCFEDVRIRVKDKQSIPGWSRSSASQTSLNSRPTHVDRSFNDELSGYLETPTLMTEASSLSSRMNEEVIEPMRSKQRMASSELSEPVDTDVSATISTHEYTLESGERSELEIEAVELSGERGSQDNDSDAEPEVTQPIMPEKNAIGQELNEVEVTSEAGVGVFHADSELEVATQRKNIVSPEESLWQTTEAEKLQESSNAQVEIKIGDTENQASVEEIQNEGLTMVESGLESDILLKEKYDVESSELIEEITASTMIDVVGEEVPVVLISDEDFEAGVTSAKKSSEDEMKANVDQSLLVEVSVSDRVEQEKQDPKQNPTTAEDTTAKSKPLDAPSDAAQTAGANMKKKNSMQRKSRRSRQAKKTSESVIVDNAEYAATAV